MAERDDVDALSAREAALSEEVADKQRQRDAAARLLAEARGEHPTPERTPRRASFVAVSLIGLAVAGGVIAILISQPSTPPSGAFMGVTLPPLTCQQIQPAYEAAGHDANLAYEAALAVKHLRRIDLARDGTRSPPGEDSPEQPLEPLVAWAPFTDRVDGRTVTAIASDVYLSDRGHALVEFVTDGNGGLWRVKRSPHSRIITSVSVEACSWGCWGGPSSPVPMRSVPTQDVWVVPAGATFRGEIEIEYDEPTVDVLIVDLQCPSPA